MYCPFTGLGLHNGYRGDKWLENRIKVFKEYVIPSLLNQTRKNFIVWVSFRPEEKDNPQVIELKDFMDQVLPTVFTYGGLCFWDDKLPDDKAREKLLNNLKITLPELKDDCDKEVYVTIQPSDDCYIGTAAETIQDNMVKQGVGWKKGYIIDYSTKEIAEYNPETNPPFYTLRFDRDTFLDPQKHIDYAGFKSHEYAPVEELEGRGFIVGTHGDNISTTFSHPYKGRTLDKNERDKVLLSAGIYTSSPILTKGNTRLLARKVLNKLPFNDKIRDIYHKLGIDKYV